MQQAQYFQQSSSNRAGNSRRKMSRGMSHQKVPGGHSGGGGGRGRSRCHVSAPHPLGLRQAAHLPQPACQLTLPPLHQDGAVGPGGAITLDGVTVGTVVVLVPEGAVLHHLLRCTRRRSAGHPSPPGPPRGLVRRPLLTTALLWAPAPPPITSRRKTMQAPGKLCLGMGRGGAPSPGVSKAANLCLSWASLRSWASRTFY